MKIIFSKDIQLNCAEAYLRIKKQVECKDIQEFLNGKVIGNQRIEERMKEYLKREGVLEKDGCSLTLIGRKVRYTGKISEYEEGKYRFWYVDKDNFLGTKILYFNREGVSNNRVDEIDDLDIKDSEHFLLKDKNIVFEVKSDKIYGRKLDDKEQINFSWIWEGLEKSFYEFSGKIKIIKYDINSGRIPQQFQLEKEILKWIDWDTTHNRLKWRLEFDGNTLKSPIFEDFVHHYAFEKEDFRIELRDVPVMPIDKIHAEEWRNQLLLKRAEENYLNEDDFKYESKIIGEKEGLKMYELTEPDRAKFLKRRENSINQKWHLQAPLDLNPNKYLPLGTPISFEEGTEFTFDDFVKKLSIKNPDCVVVCDRYAIDKSNIKMLDSFLNAINASKNIIISFEKENEEDYYLKDYQKIKEKSELIGLKTIYKQTRPFHDRSIIFIKNNQYYIFKGTGSFNTFLKWDKNKRTYEIVESTTYTPISEKYYNKKLMKLIKETYEN